jgi:MazG family protein
LTRAAVAGYRLAVRAADPGERFLRLVDIMARLRAPGGCPWDREQTPETLRPYLLEEAHEVLDALAREDADALREELGDLLLQIVFQAQLAAEDGRFTIVDVIDAISDKLVRRHPHVFGDVEVRDAADVVRNWARIKAEERRTRGGTADLFGEIPATLPALARAQRSGERAAHAGLDWPHAAAVFAKVGEELEELARAMAAGERPAVEAELGDLLLTIASLARHLDCAAEMALRAAIDRFVARTRRLEALVRSEGRTLAELDAEERERLWSAVKVAESAAGASRPRV